MLRLARSIRGNTFAKSAIESALLDALGKRLHLPVSELLGGRVRDALPVAWTLASGNTEQDIAEAEKMLDLRRHRVFKLKIGAGEVSADLAHVIAIKKPGERASVRVDVNQAWDEAVALRACKVLGDNAIDLIEQPISRNNRAGMARLQLSSPAPIMAMGMLCGSITYDPKPTLLPITRAMARAEKPELMCTTVPPAKSRAPIRASQPPAHTQWARGS